MRKRNILVGAIALSLGIIVGTMGVSYLTNPDASTSFIAKLTGQNKIQTVSGSVSQTGQTSPTGDGLAADLSGTSAVNPNEKATDTLSTSQNGSGTENTVSDEIKQKIIADYKQDIGTFFGAWKSVDIATFRVKLAKAYTGDLLEKHAKRAEEYLSQGIGLDVSQVTFDQVTVESADTNTATLLVDYRYTAKDYNLTNQVSIGEAHEQVVHMRVNLLKQNSSWLITGESVVE